MIKLTFASALRYRGRLPPPRTLTAIVAAFSWAALGCSSGTKTTAEKHAFKDDGGRSCEATLERTSPGAPPVSESVSCDATGKQCSAEASPCFQLNVDKTSGQIRNCPACCKGTASSFVGSDCGALVCETAADCVYNGAVCNSGTCTCPDGYCE